MDPLPSSELIRRYADGELEPEQAAEVEQSLRANPELAAAVRFEQKLRDQVASAMRQQCPSAPAGLADRVREALPVEAAGTAEPACAQAEPSETERGGWLVGPRRANLFAMAACLAIVAGAVIFGVFGPRIDSLRGGGAEDLWAAAATFAAGEHDRCAMSADAQVSKVQWTSPEEAEERLSAYLGQRITVLDFEALGFTFKGAGRCQLPVAAPSGHVIYTRAATATTRRAMLSIFLAPDDGQFPEIQRLVLGQLQECQRDGQSGHRVLRATDGHLVYFVVCCDETMLEPICQVMQPAIGGPVR